MSEFYDEMVEVAKELITEFGTTATWRGINNSASNPSTPWIAGDEVITDTEVVMVFITATKESKETLRYIKGSSVPAGVVVGLMPPYSFTPALKDIVIRDGKQLTIKNIDVIKPADKIVMYTVEFNR